MGFADQVPHLAYSSLHPCLQRHHNQPATEVEGHKPKKQKFAAAYPIGYFHMDIAEVHAEDGKFYSVAVDRTSKFTVGDFIPTPRA